MERKKKVLFIYAAEGFEKLGNMNQLGEDNINRILKAFSEFDDSDKYSRVVEHEEIRENDYNLSVTRYVDAFDPPEAVDVQQVWDQLKELEEKRRISTNMLSAYIKELGYE